MGVGVIGGLNPRTSPRIPPKQYKRKKQRRCQQHSNGNQPSDLCD